MNEVINNYSIYNLLNKKRGKLWKLLQITVAFY